MQGYEARIRELLEGIISREGMELIHIECLQMKSRYLVRLFLDKESGVTIDDCASISEIAGDVLDIHDIPPGAYTLEVSSPGINRPLSRLIDFERFSGALAVFKMRESVNGKKSIKGRIQGIVAPSESVLLSTVGGVYEIPLAKLYRANLLEESGKDR